MQVSNPGLPREDLQRNILSYVGYVKCSAQVGLLAPLHEIHGIHEISLS